VVMSACAGEPAESTTRDDVRGGGSACSIVECGENGTQAGDGLLFDEIDLSGSMANYAGTTLLGVIAPSGHVGILNVIGPEITVKDPYTGVIYNGVDVRGSVIYFKHTSGVSFQVLIDAVDKQSVTYQTGAADQIPVYQMKARVSTDPKKGFAYYVCNNDMLDVDPTWSISEAHYALAFRSERYDGDNLKAMPVAPAGPWAFLACNGSAASKMQLWRHTLTGAYSRGSPTYFTTLDQRTAMLKAITADYCGNGESQTVTGTPFVFATVEATDVYPFVDRSVWRLVEARWTPQGAACLDEPRRAYLGDPVSHASVEEKCGHTIPYCTPAPWWLTSWPDRWWTSETGDEVITGIPWY